MIWMPTHITWNIWFGTNTSGPPNYTPTMTQGQAYTHTQELGGNQFAGHCRHSQVRQAAGHHEPLRGRPERRRSGHADHPVIQLHPSD
jgi:hypothetical protein